jgi:hypothetical protein
VITPSKTSKVKPSKKLQTRTKPHLQRLSTPSPSNKKKTITKPTPQPAAATSKSLQQRLYDTAVNFHKEVSRSSQVSPAKRAELWSRAAADAKPESKKRRSTPTSSSKKSPGSSGGKKKKKRG